jgi:DNA polymerase kappa
LRNADRLISELEVARDLSQYIVHVDCDAFYAAVEQLERPDLKDVPFAVGGGVLTTCNYVARQFGCRSGMAGFVAKKLCPSLILIKPNFEKYNAKAHEIREILVDYDPRFESASIDEAYLNITDYCCLKEMTPAEVVEQMRREIHEKTQVTVSAGIAANAKLAKICSNINKPNGQFVLPNERAAIMSFMNDLPTRKVNGIGRVLERELLEVGVKTCGDIYSQRQYLNRLFGEKTSDFLLNCYLGLGRTRIQPAEDYERKSVGTESTFREMSDPAKLREKLRWTAEELEKDMKRAQCKGRTLVLKIKLHTFEVYTRQVVTPRAIQSADDLYTLSLPILAKLELEVPGMRLRLMGLRCTHLVSTKRLDAMTFFGYKPRNGDDSMKWEPGKVRRDKPAFADPEDASGSGEEGIDESELRQQDTMDRPSLDKVDDADSSGFQASLSRRHGKEIVPNPKKKDDLEVEEDWWNCPICGRPQSADERRFNEHIDLCLSRQTIRDAVQSDESEKFISVQGGPKKPKGTERKRGRSQTNDPKQKRLCFG